MKAHIKTILLSRNSAVLLTFTLIGFLVYRDAIHISFLSDDWTQIGNNAWSRDKALFFRPLIDYSLQFNVWLFGREEAYGYYINNILLHIINAFLVYHLIRYLSRQATYRFDQLIAFGGALLFLVMARHASSVSWIVARGDVQQTTFILLSFLCFLYFKQHSRLTFLVLSLLAYGCATLSKESSLTFPLAILAYELLDRFSQLKNWRRPEFLKAIAIIAPFFAVFFLHLHARYKLGIQSQISFNHFELSRFTDNYTQQIFAALPPKELFIALGITNLPAITLSIFTIVLTATFIFLGLYHRNTEYNSTVKQALLCFLIFLVMVIPVSQIDITFLTSDILTRHVYLPSTFLIISLCLLLCAINACFSRRWVGYTISATILAPLIISNIIFIQERNLAWNRAGVITQQILRDVAALNQQTGKPIIVIGLPAYIDSSYIFYNGFSKATRLHNLAAYHPVVTSDENFHIESLGNQRYRITSLYDDWVQIKISKKKRYKIKVEDSKNFVLTNHLSYPLSYYANGRLHLYEP